MARKKQNKAGDTLINRLFAFVFALFGKVGIMLMGLWQDVWGLSAVMRFLGTGMMWLFWWPYYLVGILTNSLIGFNLNSHWITQSWIFSSVVSFFGWYFVLSILFSRRGGKRVSGRVRQIG